MGRWATEQKHYAYGDSHPADDYARDADSKAYGC